MATHYEDEYSDDSCAEQSDEIVELSVEDQVEQLTGRVAALFTDASSKAYDPCTPPNKDLLSCWWKDVGIITEGRDTDKVTYLFHCTKPENKKKIQQEKKLLGQSATLGPLSTDPNVKGVFFTTSLYKGKLPTKSPYGPDRILIPFSSIIKNLDEWSLYFEMAYYTTRQWGYRNQFLRLVLVKNSNEYKKWCDKRLHKLEPKSNCLLCWTGADVKNVDIYKFKNKLSIYTIVFVVGDVATNVEGVKWDKVESQSKPPSKLNAKSGVYVSS